jgi:hypothetical protein
MPAGARPLPLRVVVAAPPGAPGVSDLLERAGAEAAAGADVSVLFTGEALRARWQGLVAPSVHASVCSRSARDLGVPVPEGFLPSSLAAYLREGPAGTRLWLAFA